MTMHTFPSWSFDRQFLNFKQLAVDCLFVHISVCGYSTAGPTPCSPFVQEKAWSLVRANVHLVQRSLYLLMALREGRSRQSWSVCRSCATSVFSVVWATCRKSCVCAKEERKRNSKHTSLTNRLKTNCSEEMCAERLDSALHAAMTWQCV